VKVQLQNIILLLIIIFLVVSSCHEETDTQIPDITIISPFEGQSFFVPDTVQVEAETSNNLVLTNLSVGLVNDQFVSVLPTVYLFPDNATYHVCLSYPVSDPKIESGDYYLYIRAEDESGFKNKYQKIYINGIPKVLEKIIVLSQEENGIIGVNEIDPGYNVLPMFEVSGDFTSSEIDSKNRQLYIAGISIININAYNLDTHELEWKKEPLPPLPLHTSNCLCFEENLYASCASYFIYGYRYNGVLLFNTTIEENKLPSRIMKYGDFLLADLQSKTGGFSYLATYYLVSGVEKQHMTTNYKVVDFHNAGENQVLVVANNNEDGTISIYNPNNNSGFTLYFAGEMYFN